MTPHPHEQTPIVKSADEARAGVTGHKVRHVLALSLAGGILVFVACGI